LYVFNLWNNLYLNPPVLCAMLFPHQFRAHMSSALVFFGWLRVARHIAYRHLHTSQARSVRFLGDGSIV
jgi:hypothetical protein